MLSAGGRPEALHPRPAQRAAAASAGCAIVAAEAACIARCSLIDLLDSRSPRGDPASRRRSPCRRRSTRRSTRGRRPCRVRAERVDVVPAVWLERIGHHRGAEHVAHLAAGHPGLDLVHVAGLQQVALLDVRPVYAAWQARGRRKQWRQGSQTWGAIEEFCRSDSSVWTCRPMPDIMAADHTATALPRGCLRDETIRGTLATASSRSEDHRAAPQDPRDPRGQPAAAHECRGRLPAPDRLERGHRPRHRLPGPDAVRSRRAGDAPSLRGRHGRVRGQRRHASRPHRVYGLRPRRRVLGRGNRGTPASDRRRARASSSRITRSPCTAIACARTARTVRRSARPAPRGFFATRRSAASPARARGHAR